MVLASVSPLLRVSPAQMPHRGGHSQLSGPLDSLPPPRHPEELIYYLFFLKRCCLGQINFLDLPGTITLTQPLPAHHLPANCLFLFTGNPEPIFLFMVACATTMSSDLVLPYGHGQALAVWDTSVKHVEELTLLDSEDESGVPGISPRGTTSSS